MILDKNILSPNLIQILSKSWIKKKLRTAFLSERITSVNLFNV